MITVNNVSLDFSGQKLFSDVNLLFNAGNCHMASSAQTALENPPFKDPFRRAGTNYRFCGNSGQAHVGAQTGSLCLRLTFRYWIPLSRAIHACMKSCSRRMLYIIRKNSPKRMANLPQHSRQKRRIKRLGDRNRDQQAVKKVLALTRTCCMNR